MLTTNPLTGYGISNLELLLLLISLGTLAGAGYWLFRRRWQDEVRRRDSALLEAQRRSEELQGELAAVQRQRELDEARHRSEIEEVRARHDSVRIKELQEHSERMIAHQFGSPLFDIAERGREAVPRVRPDQPDLRIVLNDVNAKARELLQRTKVILGSRSLEGSEVLWETLRTRRVLEGVVKEQLAYAEARGVRILTDYGSLGPILTDKLRLHDLCTVVIHNAIKFSPERVGEVKITQGLEDENGQRMFIEAHDNGRGIDPKDRERIFEGMGLNYGRSIAHQLRGDLVLVESKPKEGSVFRIILPCDEQADSPPPGAQSDSGLPGAQSESLAPDEQSDSPRSDTTSEGGTP
jgi:signal transduction histidine kinase